MYLVDLGKSNDMEVFNLTVRDLCIGVLYYFSVYMANIIQKQHHKPAPKIRFEVRSGKNSPQSSAHCTTGEIPADDNLTWTQYSLSFLASTDSVTVLMFPDVIDHDGSDLAIDDIELRVSSTERVGYCSSG